jgi:putative transposase
MISQVSYSPLMAFRFSRSIISYAVWAYQKFALSLRDVEDLLAERCVIVSYESIRVWGQRFGTLIAAKIRRDRPAPADKWHIDEVVVSIRRQKHWLWRAVDANGDVLEILVQSRRNTRAAGSCDRSTAQLRRGLPGSLPGSRRPLA